MKCCIQILNIYFSGCEIVRNYGSSWPIVNEVAESLGSTRIGVKGMTRVLTPWTSRQCRADTQVVAPAWRIPVTVQQKVVRRLPSHCPRPICSRAGLLALPSQFDKPSVLTCYWRFWTLLNSSLTSRACHTQSLLDIQLSAIRHVAQLRHLYLWNTVIFPI